MAEIHLAKCDGCERTISLKEADGWWTVHQVVVSTEKYQELVTRAEATGYSGAISGDFCSLPCLAKWATNADTLRLMEPGEGDFSE